MEQKQREPGKMKLMLEKIWNEIVRFAHGKMAVDLFGPRLLCLSRSQHEMRMFICDSATMPRCCFFALTAWTIPPCAQKMKNKRNLIYETYCYYCSFVFVIYFCVFIHTQFWLLLDSFFSTLSLPPSLFLSLCFYSFEVLVEFPLCNKMLEQL